MQIFETRDDLQKTLTACRQSGQHIGLVPTMGNLHEGHLTLIDAARTQCQYVLSTIFVNPLQFGSGEDLDKYPKTLETDYELLAARHCDGVFVPSVSEMYPNGTSNQTLVSVPTLSRHHCGLSRPGHFEGVCTIVSKLFNLTMPDIAFFGEKDYQQLQIIKKMTTDLCIPIKVIGVPTQRTDSGLAMSSRNNYLEDSQLAIAANLQRSLKMAADKLKQGETNFSAVELDAGEFLTAAGLKVDYFNISHAMTLEPAAANDRDLVILAAALLGKTRLIDNIRVHL
jgi:pantoate--beta-alanine ligase